MIAITETPSEHMVLPHIRWETFERILDEIGKKRCRIAYRNGDLEFTTASFEHHSCSRWMDNLIFFAALELNAPICSGGSTTLKDSLHQVAIEPDACFWIKHEAQMRGKKQWKALTDPPPDLAVEIAISGCGMDRLAIYAELKVPEVWHLDGECLRVLVFGANGKYKERTKSLAFPIVPVDGFVRFVNKLGSKGEISLMQEFTNWLQSRVGRKMVSGKAR